RDELIVDIETDSVVVEVVAPANGSLKEILEQEGDTVQSNEVIAQSEEGAADKSDKAAARQVDKTDKIEETEHNEGNKAQSAEAKANAGNKTEDDKLLSPAARRIADENNIDPQKSPGTGKDGRVTKEDAVNYLKSGSENDAKPTSERPAESPPEAAPV